MKKRAMLALLAAAPAVTFAQMGGSRRRGSGDKGGAGGGKGGGAQINQLEATLGEFETDLKLTGDQQKAWNAYADNIRALQKDIARDRAPRATDAQLDLAKRLDRAADVARDRLTAVEDIVDSAKGLLKTLTPEQRTMADPRLATLIGMSFGEIACGSGARPQKLELIRSTEEEKQSQLNRLRDFHKRNQNDCGPMLERLRQAVIKDENVFAVLMDAVRVCSLGQITHALFEVGGQYRRSM